MTPSSNSSSPIVLMLRMCFSYDTKIPHPQQICTKVSSVGRGFMAQSSSPRKDLAVRESILGVLKTKDRSGNESIKLSEFDGVIQAFGLSWESTAVKNVLEHCKIDREENINFSALKNELAAEKQRLNAIAKQGVRRPIVVATPQASGLIKEKQQQIRERQQRAVQQQTDQVHTIYNMLSNHTINKNTAVNLLSQHQIYPTRALLKIASEMEINEVPFADFNRALTIGDPFPKASAILATEATAVLAGSPRRAPVDRFAPENSSPGRRLFETPPSQHFVPPEEFAITEFIKPGRKFLDQEGLPRAKVALMGAVLNESGESWLGNPDEIDWSTSPSGRRHAAVDDRFNPNMARAQLSHGDCISWSQYETELEARNAALARPEGRKLDEQALWTNHLSDVVSWNKKGDAVSPEEAVRSEFALLGGLSVASGQRNATSQKNILAWVEPSPKRRASTAKKGARDANYSNNHSPSNGVAKASAAVLNIGELDHQSAPALSPQLSSRSSNSSDNSFAGSPSVRPIRACLRKATSFSNFSPTSPPFGVDDGSSGVKSPVSYYQRGRTPNGGRYAPTSKVAGGEGTASPSSVSVSMSNVVAGVRLHPKTC